MRNRLTPKGDLPEVIVKLKGIKEYLTEKEPGKKSTLGRIVQYLLSAMMGGGIDENRTKDKQLYRESITSFRDSLEELIEKELPKLQKV